MRIVGIYGSMRKNGNSDWIMNTILNAAEVAGAGVERILLRDLRIGQCIGCDSCATTGKCCLQDDMQLVYPKLTQAQVIIISTPNYFKNVSGLTKIFIDRTNALLRLKRQLRDIYGIGISVGGEELEDSQHCEDAISRFFRGHKIKTLRMIKVSADKIGQAAIIQSLEEELTQLGKAIALGDRKTFDSVLWK